MMSEKICTKIMRVRMKFGARRSKLLKQLAISSRLSARRERQRRGRATSMRLIRSSLLGKLKTGDRKDKEYLDRAARRCEEDVVQVLKCLKEATQYLEDAMDNPNLRINNGFRHWNISLDQFLLQMRKMVEYPTFPANRDENIIDHLVWRLSQMRIHEVLSEQMLMRWKLEDALKVLFDGMEEKFKMMGC